jgi:hypothetical protein
VIQALGAGLMIFAAFELGGAWSRRAAIDLRFARLVAGVAFGMLGLAFMLTP